MPVTRKPTPDRSKIKMDDDTEVKYWTRHLGVTREQLGRAIEKVGNAAATVRKELEALSPSKEPD